MKYLWMKNGMTGYLASNADLDAAVDDGAAIVADDEDGATRLLYSGIEWLGDKPDIDGEAQSFVIVAPQYVDDRMIAVVDVFDALASELSARTVSVMSADDAPASNATSTMDTVENPFLSALERLKVIVNGDV